MGLLRNRGPETAGGTRYQMRQRLLAVGDDSWIEDAEGRRAFKVDGKALRVRQTFVLEDAGGREVARCRSASSPCATRWRSSATVARSRR